MSGSTKWTRQNALTNVRLGQLVATRDKTKFREVDETMRVIQKLMYAASGAAVAGLLSFNAQAEERFSELKLDQLSADQQKMATVLATPPRNSRINGGPFNAYAPSPALGGLLLQRSDFLRFNSSRPPRLRQFAFMVTARQWSPLYCWRLPF